MLLTLFSSQQQGALITGGVNATLDVITLSASGTIEGIGGQTEIALGPITVSTFGQVSSTGTTSRTLDLLVASSVQGAIVGQGALSRTLSSLIANASGEVKTTGEVLISLGSILGAGTGRFPIGIDTAFLNLIKDDPAVGSLLGPNVFPVMTPDNQSFPCVTITRKVTRKDHSLTARNRYTIVEFDVDIYVDRDNASGGMLKAREISKAIRARANNFQGDYQDVKFFSIKNNNETEYYDSELEAFQVSQRYRVEALDSFYSQASYRWTGAYQGNMPQNVNSVDIDTAFRLLLSGNNRIAAMVGSRIYPITTPDDPVFPLILITKKRTSRNYTMTEEQRFVENVYDIDVFTERMGAVPGVILARRIANEIRTNIDEYSGTFLNVNFQGILHSGEYESYDSRVEIVRVSQEYRAFGWE
jgi:hypothetical protein